MRDTATFRSLRHRNARLYFLGLVVSNVGTWLQATAQAWLVYEITDNGLASGAVVAAQFLPMLLMGAWAGAVADRTNRRRLVFVTQAAAGVQALVLGVLVLAGFRNIAVIFVLTLVLGVVAAFDTPARRSFVSELVGPDELANAMSLNTAVMTGSRIAGPALAGALLGLLGAGWCFVLNGVSFVAVLLALVAMDRTAIRTIPPVPRRKGQVAEAVRVVARDPALRLVFVVLVVVSTFAFNYQVVLPMLVRRVFSAGEGTFAALMAVTSVGSLIGSLLTARRTVVTLRYMVVCVLGLGVSMGAVAFAPTLAVAFVCSVPMGITGAAFIASTSGLILMRVVPEMRGRMLALQSIAFLGSTPIGGPAVGALAEWWGSRWGLGIGGVVALATWVWAVGALRAIPSVPGPGGAGGPGGTGGPGSGGPGGAAVAAATT